MLFDAAPADPEPAGDLGVGNPFQLVQAKHPTRTLRKTGDSRGECSGLFAVHDHPFGIGAVVHDLRPGGHGVLDAQPLTVARSSTAPFTDTVEGKVLGGTIQIRAPIRDGTLGRAVDAEIKLLHDLLGFASVAQAADEEPQQLAPQVAVELRQSL